MGPENSVTIEKAVEVLQKDGFAGLIVVCDGRDDYRVWFWGKTDLVSVPDLLAAARKQFGVG